MIIPVILCGGSGTRLWPVSRVNEPKQFQKFGQEQTLLQQTLERCQYSEFSQQPVIVCSDKHRLLVQKEINKLGINAEIILEPVSRESCAALTAACLHIINRDPDALILALAVDHAISDHFGFIEALEQAKLAAQEGYLVTFGIEATRPETGYGYIQPGKILYGAKTFRVKAFVEKPEEKKAAELIARGYLWNSGNFLVKAPVFLKHVKRYAPEIYEAVAAAIQDAFFDHGFIKLGRHSFAKSPRSSIDVAIMEKTKKAAVCAVSYRWSDMGSWDNLWESTQKDNYGNVQFGDVALMESYNNYVRSDDRLTAILGIENAVVITTKDAVLVAKREKLPMLKSLVAELDLKDRDEIREGPFIYRPWGYYEILDVGKGYKIKRITVEPRGILSLQKHLHRSENWTIAQGIAHVMIDEKTFELHAGQAAYIPEGAVHRLQNRQNFPLILIEVQTGHYLEENDIIRFDDNYNRQ